MDDLKSPAAGAPSNLSNDGLSDYGGRHLVGYAGKKQGITWPGGAVVALNFVINYEEGGESCILHGDTQSEHLLSEIVGAAPVGKKC
jgi:hypothetical protein